MSPPTAEPLGRGLAWGVAHARGQTCSPPGCAATWTAGAPRTAPASPGARWPGTRPPSGTGWASCSTGRVTGTAREDAEDTEAPGFCAHSWITPRREASRSGGMGKQKQKSFVRLPRSNSDQHSAQESDKESKIHYRSSEVNTGNNKNWVEELLRAPVEKICWEKIPRISGQAQVQECLFPIYSLAHWE